MIRRLVFSRHPIILLCAGLLTVIVLATTLIETRPAFASAEGWQMLIPNGSPNAPPARASNTISAWDNQNNRFLVFGGYDAIDSNYFNDLWQYTNANGWQQLTAQGDPSAPVPRTNQVVVWDSQQNRLLIFGGFYNYGSLLNDLWQYTNANGWQQLTANGAIGSPPARDDAIAVWDTQNNRLLLFGGWANQIYNDLWQYTDSGGWQQYLYRM